MSRSDTPHSGLRKTTVVWIGAIVITLWLAGAFLPQLFSSDLEHRGQFGDQFGAVNSLFSGFAFAGVIYAVLLQSKELELQRRELHLTRKELKRSATAQRDAQLSLAEQAQSAARSVAIMHQQWQAVRSASVVPIQISIDEVSRTSEEMLRRLDHALARQDAGFGSVDLPEVSLAEARIGARGLSKELFELIDAAERDLGFAVQISKRQVGGRGPHDSWRDARAKIAQAQGRLHNAAAIASHLLSELNQSPEGS